MIQQNLHTHSTFDDGQNTMEEMVLAAVSAGLTSLGFSVHTPMPYPTCWTIPTGQMPDYIAEARRLKDAYRDQIEVYCGAEWDLYSAQRALGFDYVIGSIHHIPANDILYGVDSSAEETEQYLKAFGGSADAAAEAYFRQYEALANIEEVDIIGHLDLLTKFDEQRAFFNPDSRRFHEAAVDAMELLITKHKIFEINTGAISRGYRTTPYPSSSLLREIVSRGGRITITADAHSARDVNFRFEEATEIARSCGATEIWQFDGKDFVPVPLR
ncbi:MAG: histidinol-phosphatase [Eubacteriales bacterium]|nr:histidinol-phosphatase [Eubacteriales bacterium]